MANLNKHTVQYVVDFLESYEDLSATKLVSSSFRETRMN